MTASMEKQIILENPFHPLDLSAHDLLTIKKRYAVSGEANRNPKQELPVETIAQLISTLKGCRPSYVQKCMSQALIKESISWKDFLGFLDQESEMRYKILDWLLREKAIISYKFKSEMPFRQKIEHFFENITNLDFIEIGDDKAMITSIDCKKIHLISLTDNNFEQIDSYVQKNKKIEVGVSAPPGTNSLNQSHIPAKKNGRKLKHESKQPKGISNKSMMKSERNVLSTSDNQHLFNSTVSGNKLTEDAYYKKERKAIHSMFSLFNDLPLEESHKVAEVATDAIRSRSINSAHVLSLKDRFSHVDTERNMEFKEINRKEFKPLDRAQKNLTWLYQQKSGLSYNPYKPLRSNKMTMGLSFQEQPQNVQKKIGYDRKQKEYLLESNQQKFCAEISCIGIVYYNLEVCLVKVTKQYNKIVLQEQDKFKMTIEKDHKKNQIIEGVEFYYHRITNKWFLMVLVRNQFKNEYRSQNDSFIRGFEIQTVSHEWKEEKKYRFAGKKEDFIIDLGKNEVVYFLSQPEYGIHLITHTGKYLTWKEDYDNAQEQTVYWKKDYEERFKGAGISLSCICICPELNKALIGTIKGTIIIYDLFSKQYKMKKLNSCPVFQIRFFEERGYILYENQKLIIYDILRDEEIQVLNVRNEEKLHDKVRNFTINKSKIYCYGTCIRVFEQFIDESLQHEKFKMENIYTWRINKLSKNAAKNTSKALTGSQRQNEKDKKGNKKQKYEPTFRKESTCGELVIRSANLIAVLTQIQEVIFMSSNSLEVKFTIILDVPYDEKVMKMTLSPDEKLLTVLLYNQKIYVFNIYTQELVMEFSPTSIHKYTSISFLDTKNEYMLATGTENGKLVLFPSTAEKQYKCLEFHKKPISIITLTKDLLVTICEMNQIAIWQLPFNVLRHEIKIKNSLLLNDSFSQCMGYYLEICYLRTMNGKICELNISKGEMKSIYSDFTHWIACSIDPVMGYLIGIDKNLQIQILERKSDNSKWAQKTSFKIENKSQIIGITVVPSQKTIFFTQAGFCVWNYGKTVLGKFNSFIETI